MRKIIKPCVKKMTVWCYIILLLMLVGSRSTLGQRVDTCEEESNCTIQVSETSALHCSVGRMMECDRLRLPAEPTNPKDSSLYTQLSSISIIKRRYHDTDVDSLNFSFILPSSDISAASIQGVKAEFMEANGYSTNPHYQKTICRFFNFSGSSFSKTDMEERTLEIPYPCIGIGISPSVFHLSLTSVPTSHRLDYVITWEETAAAYDIYDDYDDPPAVWRYQLLAVATDAYRRMVHVVFQGPELQDQISLLEVSLIKDEKIVQTKRVEIGVTRVTFEDVGQGQYRVKVFPRGGLCEVTSCNILTSAVLEMKAGKEDEDTSAMVILGVILAIVLVSLVIIVIICMRKRWTKDPAERKRTILVISLTTRSLEEQTTSKFCEFLAATLHTTVVYTLLKSSQHVPREFCIITPTQSLNEGESLLPQVKYEENADRPECYKCCIILQFSYPCNQLSSQSTSNHAEIHEDHTLIRDLLSHKQNKGLFKLYATKTSKRKQIFVTFVKDLSHMFVRSPASEQYVFPPVIDSTGDALEDDQVTVMLHPPQEPAEAGDTMSLCNRFDSHALSHSNDGGQAYFLPHDIYKLHKDLSSLINTEDASSTEDKVTNCESWQIALVKFDKAAENQLYSNTWMDHKNSMSDMITVTGIMTENEVDINNSLQRHQCSSLAGNQNLSGPNSIFSSQNFIPPSPVKRQSQLTDAHPALAENLTVDSLLGMNSQALSREARNFNPQSSMLSINASLRDSFSNMTEAEETFRQLEDLHARDKTSFWVNNEVTCPERESSKLTLKIPQRGQCFSEDVGNGELGASSSSYRSMRTSGYGSSCTDMDQPPWRDQWKTVSESHAAKPSNNAIDIDNDDDADISHHQNFDDIASPRVDCDKEETFSEDHFGKASPDHRLSRDKDSPSEIMYEEAEKYQRVNGEVSKTRHIPEICLSRNSMTECPVEFAQSLIPPDIF